LSLTPRLAKRGRFAKVSFLLLAREAYLCTHSSTSLHKDVIRILPYSTDGYHIINNLSISPKGFPVLWLFSA